MIVDSMEVYEKFIQNFIDLVEQYINQEALEILKNKYKNNINSNRTLESIENVKDLLKVLEKRGVLQYDKIYVLRFIANEFVNDCSIKKLFLEYEQWLETHLPEIKNLYECAQVLKERKKLDTSTMPNGGSNFKFGLNFESTYNYSTTSVPSNIEEKELKISVINKISNKVGKFWRDIVRKLNIQESFIDELDSKYNDQPNSNEIRFKKAMDLYFSESRPKWKTDLKKALESSRRKDLKEEVEDFLNG